jgi:hypothetical protein
MTTGFLFFADLVLLLRFPLLLADGPASTRRWLTKGLIETLALGLFAPHALLLGAGVTNIGLNVAAAFVDRRLRERNGSRLAFGLIQIVALSIWFSPGGGITFRTGLINFGHWLETASALGVEITRLGSPAVLKMLLGLLLAANEANLLVRWSLGWLEIKPGGRTGSGYAGIDANEFNRGRVIGILERVLIYAFVLGGQFGAIGFTLAAKGFTRFKELENRSFAEYVLIGTLLSSSVALAAGVWIKFTH